MNVILAGVFLSIIVNSYKHSLRPAYNWRNLTEFNAERSPAIPKYKPAKTKIIEQMIIKNLMKDYDWRLRPQGLNDSWPDTGGPVVITVNIYLRSISKVDDVSMEYSTQFTFREEWLDPRLAYSNLLRNISVSSRPKFVILVPSDQAQQIWIPDSFFQNEKTATRHLVDKPNIMIRIYPDGQILYSVRLSMSLSCPMDLANYPLDSQMCLIDMASCETSLQVFLLDFDSATFEVLDAYTTDDIKYEWKQGDPIQIKHTVNTSLPSFVLSDIRVGYCSSKTNTGEYSCLRTELYLKRLFSFYMIQLYLPSFMLVVVSWVSFWLDKTSVPGRVTLGVTTLLTMTTQASGINSKLPPVSYTKAIDVWIGVCLAFIFGALLEFALVNYASHELVEKNQFRTDETRRSSQRVVTSMREATLHSPVVHVHDSSAVWQRKSYEFQIPARAVLKKCGFWQSHPLRYRNFKRWVQNKMADKSKKIDIISRFVFPVMFFSFNICYWIVYL